MTWFGKLSGSSHVPSRPFPIAKMPEVKERTIHLQAAIKALEMADKAWSPTELDAWLMAAHVLLQTTRRNTQPEKTE
jgi:uncharacterized protein involved in high-affinity Fe2+ transport